MIVPPGRSAPEASAASTMRSAIRSFTDPPGLKYSTLASTAGAPPPWPSARVTARSLTSGVLPTRSISDSWTCISHPSRAGPDHSAAPLRPVRHRLAHRRYPTPRSPAAPARGARPRATWDTRTGWHRLLTGKPRPRQGACHARGRHRRHRPLTDRPGLQGLPHHHPARRPDRARWSPPPWPRCPSSTRPTSTTSSWAAACPAASRASTWPGWSRSCSASTTCPAPRSPGTARRRCRPPGWPSTPSRPARATCSSRPAWSA